jgi:transposase
VVTACVWALFTVFMDMDRDSVFAGRLEVVETGRRRRWSEAEKVRIVAESLRGHRQASATARRHGIPNSLLFRWRREYRQGRLCADGSDGGFVPAMVVVDAPTKAPTEAPTDSPAAGRMEIVALSGRRVIVGGDVDAAALARVLDVVERR